MVGTSWMVNKTFDIGTRRAKLDGMIIRDTDPGEDERYSAG